MRVHGEEREEGEGWRHHGGLKALSDYFTARVAVR